jgi:hypothetical protein
MTLPSASSRKGTVPSVEHVSCQVRLGASIVGVDIPGSLAVASAGSARSSLEGTVGGS